MVQIKGLKSEADIRKALDEQMIKEEESVGITRDKHGKIKHKGFILPAVTDFTPFTYFLGQTDGGGTDYALGLMLVELRKCPICGNWMLRGNAHPFPRHGMTMEKQLSNAGWCLHGQCYVNDEFVCMDCEVAGKIRFHCALCGKEQETSEIKESVGAPPEYLCETCYSTYSAKAWDEKIHELYKKHKWDHE